MSPAPSSAAPWYRDAAARSLILRRYLPWFAALSLVWEIVQLPLYAIWTEAIPAYIVFAVLHCTAGDVLIGLVALALALMLTRARELAQWRWGWVGVCTALAGTAYTIFSEWMSTSLLRWSYSDLMPILDVAGMQIGLSPLLQWLVLPPLSLYLASKV